jgi:carboxyl-terminal processing protease
VIAGEPRRRLARGELKNMRSTTKVPLIVLVGFVAAILLVFGGVLIGLHPGAQDALRSALPASWTGTGGTTADYQLQQEVLDKLDTTYYKQVDDARLKTDAIDGMVSGLDDPYTVYFDPEEYASFLEQTSGSYSGVGMTVEMKDHLVTIVSTFKGSPADLAGIKSGDVILEVDGVSTDGQNLDEVVGKIKGAEGTQVTLKIYRPPFEGTTTTTVSAGSGAGETTTTEAVTTTTEKVDSTADSAQLPPGGVTTEYPLVRKSIEIPVTDTEMLTVGTKKVAHITFYTFSDDSAQALREEVRKAVETDKVDAIILDLRSNGGGLLNEAVDVASIFIPDGPIVSTEGLHSPKDVYNATGGAYSKVPLYVLTDPYTASASEIVSGALQDDKRATLIGETTFGKGLVQSIEPLSNGGALKVTTAVYLTPLGRDINKKGIEPDVVAPDDPNTPNVDEAVQTALGLIGGRSATN